MKAIWTIISTLALANLLAIVGFMGWLSATGRVSKERVEAVRTMFSPTVEDEEAAKLEAESAAKASAEEAAKAERMARPPVTSEDRIKAADDDAEVKRQSKQRLDTDLKSLQTFLVRENERLQQWENDLRARQTAFEDEQKKVRETAGSEQFKRAMATLAGVKPKEAQKILGELLAQNKHEEVIAYIDAMDERSRSKVLAEFNKADPKMAADLLERLRTRGVASAMPVGTGEPAK